MENRERALLKRVRDVLITLDHQSLDLRDHFAGLAMQGLLSSDPHQRWADKDCAKFAYQQADAMLKERQVSPELSTDSLQLPEQDPVAWIKTNGKEPTEFEAYEYIWTHWKSGRVSLDEAYGCWTWEDITHWMPANIIEPNKPRVDDAG